MNISITWWQGQGTITQSTSTNLKKKTYYILHYEDAYCTQVHLVEYTSFWLFIKFQIDDVILRQCALRYICRRVIANTVGNCNIKVYNLSKSLTVFAIIRWHINVQVLYYGCTGWSQMKYDHFKTTFIFTYIKSDSKCLKHTDFCTHQL